MKLSHSSEKLFFPNLDGLRTIAFLMVFSEHVFWSAFKYLEIKSPIVLHFFYSIFGNGGLGVSVFFVLSGFLITYLILVEQRRNGSLDVKSFYIRRTLRIWPLYFTLLIFIFLIYPLILSYLKLPIFNNPADPWKYFVFLSNFDMIRIHLLGSDAFMHSGVTWSIGIEEQFYVLWPLLFYFIPNRFQFFIFLPFILITFIFRYFYLSDPTILYFHSLGVCSDLALGGLAAFFSFNYQVNVSKILPEKKIYRLICYLLGIGFVIFNDFLISWMFWPVINRFFVALFFVYVILDQNFSCTNFLKLSNIKSISFLGKYTYGLYLLHPIAYIIGKSGYDFLDITNASFLSRLLFSAIVFLITIFLAISSYYLLESPFLKLKNRFSYISR